MSAGVDAEVIWRVINALAGEGRDELITPKRPDLSPLRTQAAAIRRNLDELAADRAEGLIDRAQMIAATERGNRKLAEINTELAAAACVSALAPFATLGNMPVGDMIDATQARIDAAQAVWDGLDDSRKRAVIEATFHRVTVLPGRPGCPHVRPRQGAHSLARLNPPGSASTVARPALRLPRSRDPPDGSNPGGSSAVRHRGDEESGGELASRWFDQMPGDCSGDLYSGILILHPGQRRRVQ